VQQAVQELQNDIIRRKVELEAIQQSNLRRNGNNLNALKYMIERKSLFIGDESADHDPEHHHHQPAEKPRASSATSRIPKRVLKKNLSPTSHGVNVAELSMQAAELLASEYDHPDPDPSEDANYNRSKLDESFEDDEDRIKIRQIQSRYKIYSRAQHPGTSSRANHSTGSHDNDSNSPRNFFPSSWNSRLSPSSTNPDSSDNADLASASDPAAAATMTADQQLMNRLKSEQTRILFLERKIKELQEENAFLLDKLSSATHSQHSVDRAKIEVLEKRVLELESECKDQAQLIKERNLLNAKLESRIMQLEEDLLSARDELLFLRNQLQSKAVKLAALEQEHSIVKHREEELADELNEARRQLEEYEQDRLEMNQSISSQTQLPAATTADDESEEEQDNEKVEQLEMKISLITLQIDDLTKNRDEFILKASNLEETLRLMQLDKDKLSQELLSQQQRYDDLENEMVDKLLEAELKYEAMVASIPPVPAPVVAVELEPAPAPLPIPVPMMDGATMTMPMVNEAEERAAADKAQAEIEIQHLQERLKHTERALLIFKYFYKLRDKMLEGKILELQTLAEIYEQESKKPAPQPKEIIKEVYVPAPASSRPRIWNLIQVSGNRLLLLELAVI
jgi:hypothetical protein